VTVANHTWSVIPLAIVNGWTTKPILASTCGATCRATSLVWKHFKLCRILADCRKKSRSFVKRFVCWKRNYARQKMLWCVFVKLAPRWSRTSRPRNAVWKSTPRSALEWGRRWRLTPSVALWLLCLWLSVKTKVEGALDKDCTCILHCVLPRVYQRLPVILNSRESHQFITKINVKNITV